MNLPKRTVMCVVGARPNFMKIAPIMAALEDSTPLSLVHTGQHYDIHMQALFFQQLGIPEPDINLEVGSGSHGWQTAEIMQRFEPVVDAAAPIAVLVVGDVNSTIACALVAAKKQIPVIHVEAGLRSFDRSMPEEINRVLTDQLAQLLFTTERAAGENLLREGVEENRIHFVGNVMIDSLLDHRSKAVAARETLLQSKGEAAVEACGSGYAVLTLHRPANVDDASILRGIISLLQRISERIPIVFPVHPRTKAALERSGLDQTLEQISGIFCLSPVGYLEMLGLMSESRLVLTDSGGMQEETTALGIPCVTLRNNTERPITVTEGTNTVTGIAPERVLAVVDDILVTGGKSGCTPELWDGKAALRIRDVMIGWLKSLGNGGDRSGAG
ncbi:UDP-N-acetylglucosamine 2-epimerase [Nitrosococcus halophilus Nc 4]|uniref:UDP-N-acetylglucosamine 2-epimerase n=1 Tax=Nitrosococcus halophilus (strain Nc4) TaxID=472759 RepID=D5C038_NITHN|nr:UDP-N-acetylglucosamine 2-epimerase (non-hydrolyzing) [Nitrosococcus halophilus]ADE16285.1 UDP-N-acetylglucosamine 2-epimerase [Nitrosococcus halophilus Nc 4]